jgi:hypothetical protein
MDNILLQCLGFFIEITQMFCEEGREEKHQKADCTTGLYRFPWQRGWV